MDACTSEEDVRGVIIQARVGGELAIRIIDANNRGERLAIVSVQESEATKLLKVRKLKVGWIICRVRCRIPLVRCFRCLGYGHHARDCKGIDRSNTCYKCGQTGYVAAACDNEPHCALRSEMKVKTPEQMYILGTTKSRASKLALENRKKRLENGRS